MEMWNAVYYLYNENNVLKHKYETLIGHVIPEILGMKTRMEAFERNEVNKNNTWDLIVKDLINQKINVQKKLNEVNDSISHINDKLRETSEPHKMEVHNVDVQTSVKTCKFNRLGFCRERQNCTYFHENKVCEEFVNSGVCTKQKCCERHPRRCRNYDKGECRWDIQCKYLHKDKNDIQGDEEDSQNHDEESIESIMAKARAFALEESFEDFEHDDESIESLMAKARAFEVDESFLNEETQT